MSMNVGQSAIDAVVSDSETRVVNAQQMQHCGVYIVDLSRMVAIQRFVTPLVRLAYNDARFDAAAGKPVREDVGIVVAPLRPLG